MAYLGIDLGTSGLRALLVDEQGMPIGSTERHYDVAHPHSGWSEQDPADWIAALEGAVADMAAAHPEFAGVKGSAWLGICTEPRFWTMLAKCCDLASFGMTHGLMPKLQS